ncbi:lysozyme inhibitor LprI family protein [Klebsiella aerogenes]|uniref:lysozyme inhibitor LprI family protein n=1 Tax=Klebsiella aerogenes TaxID=548 RepID=UPI00073508E9|nr:lysozyme inhibitor LprI family protein [Klebsiella aerogenes]KTH33864.1 hypothetical protein ASV26_08565 [Klebsiella aerogenes]
MNKKITIAVVALLLAGCDDNTSNTIECSTDVSKSTLIDVLKKSAIEQISEQTDKYEDVTNSVKRSMLDKISFSISDVTTTSKDPNSSLRNCSATVSFKVEPHQYSELFDFYRTGFNKNLDRVMENFKLEQNTNSFSTRMDYSVQPTDDNKTVFVEAPSNNSISAGAAFISSLTIVKPYIEQANILAEKKKQERIQAQAQAQAQKNNYASNQNHEDTNPSFETTSVARDRFVDIDKKLGEIWHNLGQVKQKEMLSSQRQWIKNKDAICGKISLKGTDAEVSKMFQCQYDMTKKRISELSIN